VASLGATPLSSAGRRAKTEERSPALDSGVADARGGPGISATALRRRFAVRADARIDSPAQSS